MICCKDDAILLKNSAFRELQVLIELIFRFTFQFSIFILKESSKRCLIFSYVSAVLRNISQQELSFNLVLKECLICKDLEMIREKTDIVLINVYSSCTTERFKVILQCIRDLELAKYTFFFINNQKFK